MAAQNQDPRWREIDRIFAEALDAQPSNREAVVRRACGSDVRLYDAVSELLRSAEELGAFLETPGELITASFLKQISDSSREDDETDVGQRIGTYRIIREINRGGMGTVYLAERDDEHFKRQVAIKILRTGRDTEEVVSHFLAERQILASLNHKNIAQLLDGGATEDGRPYIVMEYVDGTPIDQYCDRLKLPVGDRLRLFLQGAEAVEHAHRHLVVHRDLKPSNVLVTVDGKVKLLDFGIAKLLEESHIGAAPIETRPGARLMTPEYAAPEQVLGERVRTEMDVYALSAVLYELLTGARPYAGEERASVLQRVIAGELPTRPSEVVRAATPTAEGLARTLSGDLDAILLRGLRSRPEERYGSVGELREDIERYLTGYPVKARGDAQLYRARRFVRRHWASVGAAAAFGILLAGSAMGLAVQQAAVVAERNRAEAAATEAARDAETARQVTTFLTEIFQGSDPAEQLGDTVTARFLLERGTERVRTELIDQPEIRAELLEALGSVYTSLGSYDGAQALLEEGVQLRRDTPVPDPQRLGHSVYLLGEMHGTARQYELSLDLYREAITLLETGQDGTDLALARAEKGLGSSFLMLRETDSAQVYSGRAADRYRQLLPEQRPEYASVLIDLAGIAREKGEGEEAERLYREVLDDREGLDYLTLAVTLNNLGFLRRTQGDDREAATLYGEGLDVYAQAAGRAHPTALMLAGNMAGALERSGDHTQSIEVRRASVAASEERWPAGHWRLADQYFQLGAQYLAAGRTREALTPLSESVTMGVAVLGDGHAWTPIWLGWYAAGLFLAGEEDESARRFDQSLSSLGNYDELTEDRRSMARLRAMIDYLDRFGLKDQADRYRALLEP